MVLLWFGYSDSLDACSSCHDAGPAEVIPRARLHSVENGQDGKLAQFLQYEVREGREAGEAVVLPQAFIANCNGSFILQLDCFKEV